MIKTKNHKIILEPSLEIPSREKWLFGNKVAMNKVNQGLKDAKAGRFVEKGNFAQYIDDAEYRKPIHNQAKLKCDKPKAH